MLRAYLIVETFAFSPRGLLIDFDESIPSWLEVV